MKAGDLKTGDELRSTDGSARTVSHVKTIPLTTPLKVYNFEVTDFHTYFVSNENILVHNKCGVDRPSGGGVVDDAVSNTSNKYVNLLDKKDEIHILYGDSTGGGHLYPGKPGKDFFPKEWNGIKFYMK